MDTMGSAHTNRRTVRADDGIPLAVLVSGPAHGAPTVVFVHGHWTRTENWTPLREALRAGSAPDLRMVFFDQRGHGRSGGAHADTYTVEQAGRDLAAVLRAVSAERVVLVGHSMGGMAILSYARQFPGEVNSRVSGIALISTAAADLHRTGLGRYLHSPAVELIRRAVSRAPGAMEFAVRVGGRMGSPLARIAFRRTHHRRWAALLEVLGTGTPVSTMVGFLRSFAALDESAALSVLATVPSVVVCGSRDEWTPFELSAGLAARLPLADLVCIDGAGHSVITDRAHEVARSLDGLLRRTSSGEGIG